MTIQIIENQGVFHVSGELNEKNSSILSSHLMHFFEPKCRVIINLEKVTSFDSKAAYTLLKLFISAEHRNSKMAIIGKKNKNLLQALKETNTLHIWSQTKYLK